MGPGGRGKVTSRGKSHHSEAIGRQVPLFCPASHQSNRALSVSQFDGMVVAGTEAILKHESGHTHRVEPIRFLDTLVAAGKRSVCSARGNHHGRAGARASGTGRAVKSHG